jgi:hypothetical protein
MHAKGRLLAVAAITASGVGLGGGGAQGAESLIGKWHGVLQVTDGNPDLQPYTLWIRSTKPGSVAGKSVARPDPPCVGRLIAVGTSRGWTRFVDHNYRGSGCTDGDRFKVRIASDGRLEYRGRSTNPDLSATGMLERKRSPGLLSLVPGVSSRSRARTSRTGGVTRRSQGSRSGSPQPTSSSRLRPASDAWL